MKGRAVDRVARPFKPFQIGLEALKLALGLSPVLLLAPAFAGAQISYARMAMASVVTIFLGIATAALGGTAVLRTGVTATGGATLAGADFAGTDFEGLRIAMIKLL